MPAALKPGTNGKLGPADLTPVYFPGYGWSSLEPHAKRAWDCLVFACFQATGQTLSVTPGGAYRSYAAQVNAFNQRMSPFYNPFTCTLITRTWDTKTYWLKRGYAPCATPGKSNHGWGLAADLAIWTGGHLTGVTSNKAVWTFVVDRAVDFGFSWEGAAPGAPGFEPWHLRHVLGDDVSPAVKAIEAWFAAVAPK